MTNDVNHMPADAYLPPHGDRPAIGLRYGESMDPVIGRFVAERIFELYPRLGEEIQAKLASFPSLDDFTPDERSEIARISHEERFEKESARNSSRPESI